MLDWLRRLLSSRNSDDSSSSMDGGDGGGAPSATSDAQYIAREIEELYVSPDQTEDFDKEACERLIATIAKAGAKTVVDMRNVAVSLEDFFVGNNCKHSIAANVQPAPPFDTAESWFALLKRIRSTNGVKDVVIGISMIEPYDDGRVGMWPYSDTVWIYSSLDRESIASLVAPLEPDEVRDASINDPNWDLHPPIPASPGARPYWIWWD